MLDYKSTRHFIHTLTDSTNYAPSMCQAPYFFSAPSLSEMIIVFVIFLKP